MFDNFVFKFFAIFTLSIGIALCGKRRSTARNTKTPPSKSPSKNGNVKQQKNGSAKSIKASAKTPKVVGYQPTREDEGLETDTHTKTLSDEKVKTDLNSKSKTGPRCLKQKAIEIEQQSANSMKTVSVKKKTLSDERSSKKTRKSSFSNSTDESENDSLRTMKRTSKSPKNEEKSSDLESIQTEEDDRTKTKSIE